MRRLLVRYEDLKVDTFNELRRMTHFLMDDPALTSNLLHHRGYPSSKEENRDAFVDLRRISCALRDTQIPYSSNRQDNLFSFSWLNEQQIRYITEELAPIICQLGYHELFPAWLDQKLSSEEQTNAKGDFLNCSRLETTVDFTVNMTDLLKYVHDSGEDGIQGI